jgi:hypothetical protein
MPVSGARWMYCESTAKGDEGVTVADTHVLGLEGRLIGTASGADGLQANTVEIGTTATLSP